MNKRLAKGTENVTSMKTIATVFTNFEVAVSSVPTQVLQSQPPLLGVLTQTGGDGGTGPTSTTHLHPALPPRANTSRADRSPGIHLHF